MKERAFILTGRLYIGAGKKAFEYVKYAPWFLKPIALLLATFYGVIFLIIGLIFFLLMFLDILSIVVDKIRTTLLKTIENLSHSIAYSFWSFLFSPIILIFVSILFLGSLLLPKLSSDIELKGTTKFLADIFDARGVFKKVNKILWNASNRMFQYINRVPLFLKPILGIIAIIQSIILLFVGLLFFILIPLDWISNFLDNIRESLINKVDILISKLPRSFINFLTYPIALFFLSWLILATFLIPKINVNFDFDTSET
jgi:hypothetical protein